MTPPAGTRSRLAATLLGRIDNHALTTAMVHEFRRTIPSYGAMAQDLLDEETRRLVDLNISLFRRCLAESRLPRTDELEPLKVSAQRGAAEGARLEEIIRTYHIGARVIMRELSEVCAADERPELPDVLDQLMAQMQACVGTVTLWFSEERQHIVAERERLLRDLLRALGEGRPLSDELADLGRGYGLHDHRAELVCFALVDPSRERRRHAALASALRNSNTLAVSEGVRVVGVVTADRSAPPRAGLLRVVGPPTARDEYEEVLGLVRQTADLAAARGIDGDCTIEELLPELLLARSPRLTRVLADQVLAPLAEHDQARGGQLLDTLRLYLDTGMERTVAAHRLDVHPNTVDHRLRRLRELTGLDLRRPDHMLRATLAMKIDADRRARRD